MAAGKEASAGNQPGGSKNFTKSKPPRAGTGGNPSKGRRSEERPRGSHLAVTRAPVAWPVPGFSSSSSSLSREGFRGAKNREKLCQGALPLLRPPDISPARPRRLRAPTRLWPERGWPQSWPAKCSRSRLGPPARLPPAAPARALPVQLLLQPAPGAARPREEPATATALQPAGPGGAAGGC
ncbi:hypothetical protein HispidOSU_001903 [Sigmodon hispidus]